MVVPRDSSVEAEYADENVHSELELGDVPQFGQGNVLTDILSGKLEKEHGRMVRFSCFWKLKRHDVDWTKLPKNARPIRFRHGVSVQDVVTGETWSGWAGVDFGAQWNDRLGRSKKAIRELR